ncbi:isoprenyl transferase [Schlesneria paludicola]|uniref:isoprenyl transferase n=1 Tax=Schlesneria paludicola TaxID=360056 RepID=UPI000299FB0E|nr:isoprenyl transferase [Schlesneria paludicola]
MTASHRRSADEPYSSEQIAALDLRAARLPRHVAIIMDGNGRWAQARGFPRIEGHRRGVSTVRSIIECCSRLNMQQLTLYCFSSENWKRPELEQKLLMRLLEQYLVEERAEIARQNLRFSVIGRREPLGEGVNREIDRTYEVASENTGMRLCLAINYGSRSELADAAQAIAREVAAGRLDPDAINESTIEAHLYTAGMPDPDLVIRTAGEMRVSNYLLWQISYAELWVTEKCWPDFDKDELFAALRDFAQRNRRFGGLSN